MFVHDLIVYTSCAVTFPGCCTSIDGAGMSCVSESVDCVLCSCEWTRRKTKSDEADWLYLPTIYPADALITLKATA